MKPYTSRGSIYINIYIFIYYIITRILRLPDVFLRRQITPQKRGVIKSVQESKSRVNKVEKVSSLLLELSESDLKEVKNKLDGLLTFKKSKGTDIEIELFYVCLADAIKANTGQKMPAYSSFKFKGNGTIKRLNTVHEYLNDWLKTVLKRSTVRADRLKCYTLYADLMMGYLKKGGIPVSLSTLLNVYEYFPGLFDSMFPGYVKNGIADLIFRKNSLDIY